MTESGKITKSVLLLVLAGVLVLITMTCGCTNIPLFSHPEETAREYIPDPVSPPPGSEEMPANMPATPSTEGISQNDSGESPYPDEPSPDFSPVGMGPEATLTPEPTPVSNVTDWDPYMVLPPWQAPLNHSSILKNDTSHNFRQPLNNTFSGSVGLAGFAIGKQLNITHGPFSITYTVHPNVTSPLDVWAKITIFDPWQNIIAEGGYNRGYPNQETQIMTIYRDGRHYMSIEGEFATMDYTVKTADIAPVVTQPPAQTQEEMGPEGEGPY
ncbi:MAG: hypothetical protein LUQ50_07320 [Methanospirillum sp.]|uniref:hypothetical protein n=1 Tax=Methanospirillum sp. TaxID=45200 RepID=UPI00236CF6BE|nr:hypothetical protein [Methanospirillum sp.]MDD1728863.1 hypothetical protein [Methanospirillum sp.]